MGKTLFNIVFSPISLILGDKIGHAITGAAMVVAGIVTGQVWLVTLGLSIGASALASKPKAPSLGQAMLDRLKITLDVRAPRKAVFGRTAMATDLRDQEVENIAGTVDDINVHRWIVMAAHKINALKQIWFEDVLVWENGALVGSKYKDFLTVTVREEGTPANVIAYNGRAAAGSRRYTGCAYVYFKYFINSKSPFMGSIPERATLIGEGMPVYDPRKDSTVPGGSGSQRADDQSTWSYDVSGNKQGENPACQMLTWLLGWKITNPVTSALKLSVGKGIQKTRLDMAAFITAANACDESVSLALGGSEKRYRAGGLATEGEQTTDVLDRWKAAMNATLDDVDGKIRPMVLVNDLGAPVADFTDADIINEFTWKPTETLTSQFNIIRGTFINPSDTTLFQPTEFPEVVLASRDGIDRIDTVEFGFVQSQSQAQRLAKTRLQRAQYPGFFQAAFQFGAHKVQKGDAVRLTFSPLGFTNKLFRVVEKAAHQPDGTVPMTLREENAAIYAWTNEDSAVVAYPAPITYGGGDTPLDKLLNGEWMPGGSGNVDSNLLRDNQYGNTNWTRSTINWVRIDGTFTRSGIFPIPSVRPFVGEIALGAGVDVSATYDKGNLPMVTVGRLYYLRANLAKSTTASGTATLRLRVSFLDSGGSVIGSPFDIDTALSALPSGGNWMTVLGSVIAPATAVRAKVSNVVLTNGAIGYVRFDNPTFLDKEPGADVTTTISGPVELTIDYDYNGVVESGELPIDLAYKLMTPNGQILAGITWTYTVFSGTFNTFTNASGAQSISGAGTGTLTASSLGTDVAEVDVSASYNGKTVGPFRTTFKKAIGDPPAGGGGGGGGATTKSSGFNAYNTTSFADLTGSLLYTVPTGKTSVDLSANLLGKPATAGGAGTWTSEGKWQRENTPGGGTWSDVGTAVSDGSEVIDNADDPPYVADKASLTKAVTDTGRTAGVQYSYRFVGRLTSGSRSHSVTGNVSVVSP